MVKGWEGEKIRLVPMERQRHLDNAVTWINDPEVTRWTIVGDMPVTKVAEHEFFEIDVALITMEFKKRHYTSPLNYCYTRPDVSL